MNTDIQAALEQDDITDEFKDKIKKAVAQGNEQQALEMSKQIKSLTHKRTSLRIAQETHL